MRTTRRLVVTTCLMLLLMPVAACSARLSDPKHEVDASMAATTDATMIDPVIDDADPNACATGRQVYLNFGGQVPTKAATSDATTNQVQWGGGNIGQTYSIPAYRGGDANAATTVANAIIARLAPYPGIHVTLSRPTTGPYVMLVFGGEPATIGVQGVYDFAVASQDCGDANKSDVGIVLDDVNNLEQAANLALGAIGYGMGMVGTGDGSNCMCAWATLCNLGTAVCTFSAINGDTNQCPGHADPQDQASVLQTFCQ